MYLCTCEREAEKGDFGSRFQHPFHRTPSCRAILKYNPVPLSTAILSHITILSRTVLRLNPILLIPYRVPVQKSVANSERSCAVRVKLCSSGSGERFFKTLESMALR